MNSHPFRWTVAAAAMAVVCTANAQTLTGVTTKKVGKGVEVLIKGEDLGKPKTLRVNNKRSYILEFSGKLEGKAGRTNVRHGGLNFVNYGWFKKSPAKVRVHLSLGAKEQPKLKQTDEGWLVTLNVADAPKVAAAKPSESFPNAVPPLDSNPTQKLMANAQPGAGLGAWGDNRVSLDFVNTDVVQILKALALQANVNIVTSPDVSGKITVTLENVTVGEALDLVTTLSGVRYAKVGATYVVTSNAKFSESIRQIGGRVDESSETRVVPLFSREGAQIKAAVLKSVSPSTKEGRYDLVLPSDKVTVDQKSDLGPPDDKNGTQGASNNETTVGTKTESNKKDDYVVLVGTPSRLNEVQRAVEAIDQQICRALGIKVTPSAGTVQVTYQPKGIEAEELVKSLKADPTIMLNSGVQVLATPKTSFSKQAIVLSGRANEVNRILSMLEDLDDVGDVGPTIYETVGIKYVKPQNALVEITRAVPGIRAWLLPPPVDPAVGIKYNDTANQGGGTGQNGGQGTQTGGGSGDQGNQGGQGSQSNDQASSITASTQSNSIPMKLMLFGTSDQIARAKKHLEMVDLAPKQVAVELRVMELSREDALRIGLDWNALLTGGTLRGLRFNQGIGGAGTAGGTSGTVRFNGDGGSLSFGGSLDEIATRNNLIARPNLLATDGVPATLFVGDQVRYIESIQSAETGTTVTTGQIDVGVKLLLTARVGEGGNIALDLRPELSILQGFTDVPGGGQLPQTSLRTATSVFNLRSGETIAIGGLIQDQDRKLEGGIPILKDLPIIGRLFRRTDNRRTRTEVVFFLTVKEVDITNRQGAANPRESVRTNTSLPGNGGN